MHSEETVLAAWETYRAMKGVDDTAALRAQNILIEHYYPIVGRIAHKLGRRVPPSVDQDEIASWGTFGLYRAIINFSPDRGIRFETYAVSSIQSQIMDGLRALDWAPRSLRAKARIVERAVKELEIDGHTATTEEITAKTGLSAKEIRDTRYRESQASHRSLDEGTSDENDSRYDYVKDRHNEDPADSIALLDLYKTVAALIDSMPPRTRVVLTLYYYEGLRLSEIAKVLGQPESRIGKEHGQAIVEIRDLLVSVLGQH